MRRRFEREHARGKRDGGWRRHDPRNDFKGPGFIAGLDGDRPELNFVRCKDWEADCSLYLRCRRSNQCRDDSGHIEDHPVARGFILHRRGRCLTALEDAKRGGERRPGDRRWLCEQVRRKDEGTGRDALNPGIPGSPDSRRYEHIPAGR